MDPESQSAGRLKQGDLILKINGSSVLGFSVSECAALLKQSWTVTLTVKAPTQKQQHHQGQSKVGRNHTPSPTHRTAQPGSSFHNTPQVASAGARAGALTADAHGGGRTAPAASPRGGGSPEAMTEEEWLERESAAMVMMGRNNPAYTKVSLPNTPAPVAVANGSRTGAPPPEAQAPRRSPAAAPPPPKSPGGRGVC